MRSKVADHPRSRGEYPHATPQPRTAGGSSPLSRGISAAATGTLSRTRIIPALAGNTSRLGAQSMRIRDHPRSRGEYSTADTRGVTCSGSSPLSRGIPRSVVDRDVTEGIIPALAGNTARFPHETGVPEDHPRSRGEYAIHDAHVAAEQGSSPLSRGILNEPAPRPRRSWIIPALAGNTTDRCPSTRGPRDHPRSRGEYP